MVANPGGVTWLWGAPINESISTRLAGLVALLSVAMLMVAPNAGAQSQKVATVAIRDFYFEPSQLINNKGSNTLRIEIKLGLALPLFIENPRRLILGNPPGPVLLSSVQ